MSRNSSVPTLFSLALGGLCIGTTEFAAMGLLPQMAASLGATIPEAGGSITAYALGVVVGAPLLTVLAARVDRKHLLVLLMGFYTLANLLSAFAPTLGWLIAGRFLAGLPHGAFFGVGAVLGAQVAGPGKRGQAVALMMAGLSVANIVGVPLSAWLGQALGWRMSYVGIGLLGMGTVGAVATFAPRLAMSEGASVRGELRALGNGPLWLVFAAGAVGTGGMFAVYSYVAPLLTETTGLTPATVPLVLSLFGIGMTLGNIFGGRLSDRGVVRAAFVGFGATAAVLLFLALTAAIPAAACLGLFGLGFVTSILGVSLQSRLMDLSPQAPSLGASLSHAGMNIGNATGAALGGLVLSAGWGNLAPAWVGLILTLTGAFVFLVSSRGNFR